MKLSVYMTLYTLTHVVLLIYEAKVSVTCHCPGPACSRKAFVASLLQLSASPSSHPTPGACILSFDFPPSHLSKCMPPLFAVSE